MSALHAQADAISQQDILDAAVIFGCFKKSFTAQDFTAFLQVQAHRMEEENVNEVLLAGVQKGLIREIGPGVYAAAEPDIGGDPHGGARIGGKP